jgi:hypothetical protein
MTIFKNKSKDKYKGKTRVLRTVRVDKETAIKLDELQEVCITETGETISKNTILVGIINIFINEVEEIAKTSEDKATQKVLEILDSTSKGAGVICKD